MYQQLIHEIAPHLNPAGVEASMRLQFGTLDHLSHHDFVAECRIAEECERAEPGYLKAVADSYGLTGDYKKWATK